ncbi:chromosome segregation protein SMC [Alphaproteobacteria bacterium]|nr:chromosome segregation protein SMC [Alphaproteobacteria bacterium]
MIQFTSLRLSGFKSFVEKTELEIAPGLNGIVGPNGCGKSNLVEALRWVMGETSAKRMRGGGMEDVIFNGTADRTARNIAEVSLLLDNSSRKAPAAYNDADEVEITRKIERDRGSNYKINGKNVRARDVQMLFADTVTGSNSPALVSQGQVAKIINAKPLERRLILEESAGISGLYARRHEAELRLKAADANLLRIEDILGGMETRLNSLKRQARMAGRYRNLNAQIRQLEIVIHYLEYLGFEERIKETKAVFHAAERMVAEKMTAVTQLTKTQETLQKDLPELRKAEVEAASAIQVQKIELQRIEDAEEQRAQKLVEAKEQLAQAQTDQAHEKQSAAECERLLEKLRGEREAIASEQDNGDSLIEEKQKLRDELEQKVLKLEDQYTAMMQKSAETQARIDSLEQNIKQNSERVAVLTDRKTSAEGELKALLDADEGPSVQDQARAAQFKIFETTIEKSLAAQEKTREGLIRIADNVAEARNAVKEAETKHAEIKAEIQMLESFLAQQDSGDYAVVRDTVQVDSGFEKAVSRALGDSLLASIDENAPFRWIALPSQSLPSLPDGVEALEPHIKVPKELKLAVSQIGLVHSEAEGHKLAAELLPGQSIVSRDGIFWRWDGYFIQAEAPDRNAADLEHKNKLAELQAQEPKLAKASEAANAALVKAIDDEEKLEAMKAQLQDDLGEAQEGLSDIKLAQAKDMEDKARGESEKRRLEDIIKTSAEDIATLSDVTKWETERLEGLKSASEENKEEDTEKLYETLVETRRTYQDAVRAFDSFMQKQNSQKARLHAIADENVSLNNRMIRAKEREKSLSERIESLTERLEFLQKSPKEDKAKQESLLSKISQLDAVRNKAAEILSERESEVAQNMKALREAEHAMSSEREKRAGAQAKLAGIQEQLDGLSETIHEKFEMKAHALKEHITMQVDFENPDIDPLKSQREKLNHERQSMGPVNLRADDEAQELEADVTKLLNERNDLMEAVAELRGGIATINKEARERLLLAFDHVNAHFQRLFVQLFGGGTAHLKLVEAEDNSNDPLGAGLEIFAQPPGKTLQNLSLMSGGEQTLASIALIFGMFLTNPSPICVLDEIDAPLDDANVERVCDLLDHIAARGETRFLIITHHRLTMARMDRLYGVTMSEKGVSQLVSVDLQQSFEFLEAA